MTYADICGTSIAVSRRGNTLAAVGGALLGVLLVWLVARYLNPFGDLGRMSFFVVIAFVLPFLLGAWAVGTWLRRRTPARVRHERDHPSSTVSREGVRCAVMS